MKGWWSVQQLQVQQETSTTYVPQHPPHGSIYLREDGAHVRVTEVGEGPSAWPDAIFQGVLVRWLGDAKSYDPLVSYPNGDESRADHERPLPQSNPA